MAMSSAFRPLLRGGRVRSFNLLVCMAAVAVALPAIAVRGVSNKNPPHTVRTITVKPVVEHGSNATTVVATHRVTAKVDPAPKLPTQSVPKVHAPQLAKGGEIDEQLMGRAGAALVQAIADELKVSHADLHAMHLKIVTELHEEINASRAEVASLRNQIASLTASVDQLSLESAALHQPWLGHSGEVECAAEHRCENFIDAGAFDLSAIANVAACKAYCSSKYPHVPFFAFHSQHGMTAFANHPKGRCRCYDSAPCHLARDGGYTLWSTKDECTEIPEIPLREVEDGAGSSGSETTLTSSAPAT